VVCVHEEIPMSLAELLPALPSANRPHDNAPCAPSPLPLPDPDWGVAAALRALQDARPMLPGPVPAAEPVSVLTTVVLRAGDVAVKVYPPGTDTGHLDRIATALRGSTTALTPHTRAVRTPHGVVTLAPWATATGPVGWAELGSLLRGFHAEHAAADVPRWRPMSRVPSQAALLLAEDSQVLLDARAALLDALDRTHSDLGHGTIHGDVSGGNVLRTSGGPRLIDLDWVAHGPREYDLAGAARRFRCGEIDAEAYHAFCDGYGYDVTGWPGLPILDRIAELAGVAFRIWEARRLGSGLDWLDAELQRWRHVARSLDAW
jgi:hypothetical protein